MIFHVTSVHPRYDQRIRKYVSGIGDEFKEVSLIVNDEEPEEDRKKYIIKSLNAKSKSRFFRAIKFTVKLFIMSIFLKKSVFHLHDPELIPSGILLRLVGHYVIFDVHEDYLAQSTERYSGLIKQYIYYIFIYTLFFFTRWFSALAHATPYIYQRYQKFNNINFLMPNYVLQKECRQNISILTKKEKEVLERSNEPIQLCYIGGLNEIRGIFELVEALDCFDGRVRCKIAGTFTTLDYAKMVKSSPGWKYVDFYGQVDRKEMSEIMCQSDLGVILFKDNENNRNSLPNKIFEYQSAGLGIIHSDFKHWREYLTFNKRTEPVATIHKSEVENAIQLILQTPYTCSSERIALASKVMEKYSWEHYLIKIKSFYKTLTKTE